MELAYTLSGGAPVIKQYLASATLSTRGVPVETAIDSGTEAGALVIVPASTVASEQLGVTLDTTSTISNPGDTVATADLVVSVTINPDAVWRAKLSGGTAADTALALQTTTAASADGTTLTGATLLIDSYVWGFTGSNVEEFRRADLTTTVSQAFPTAIASGDEFITAQGFTGWNTANLSWFDLTANSDQIRADVAATDTDNFLVVDVELRGGGDDGRNNSFYHIVANKHLFGSNPGLS